MHSHSLTKEQFRKLTEKTPWPWLMDAALDWCIMALAIGSAVHFNTALSYALSVLIVGNRQHALAILGHDGTHFTLVKSKPLNDFITNLFSFWPIGLTASGYRNLHFMHHKYANTPMDPELAHRSSKKPQWDLPNSPKTVLKYAAWDLFGYSISDYIMIIKFARPDTRASWIWMAGFHTAAIATCLALGAWPVLAIWYGALVTTFMMQFRLRTWLEHQGIDDTHRLHLNMAERIILSPHYAWYHYEHHHLPSVPYHRLPELRKLTPEEPVITLSQLLEFYKASDSIISGTPLKISERKNTPSEMSHFTQDKLAA